MITIDGYPIDAALEERISFEADISEDEVEKGSDMTDHIRPKLPVLEFDGVVSDTPIGQVALDPSRQAQAGQPLPSEDAYRRFVDIHFAARTVVIQCSYGKFDLMALQSLTPKKDSKSRKAFKFTAKFKQINIQENTRTTVQVSVPNVGGKVNRGFLAANNLAAIQGAVVDVVYVVTFPIANRPYVTKSYGDPVLKDQGFVINEAGHSKVVPTFDCYGIAQGRERNAEGYVSQGAGGVKRYHRFASLYDPATNSRKDVDGRDVTQLTSPKFGEPVPTGWWNAQRNK